MSASAPPPSVQSQQSGDWLALSLLATGLVAMYLTSFHQLITVIWASDTQGHGPIVLAISLWLMHRKWPRASGQQPDGSEIDVRQFASDDPHPASAWPIIGFACLLYAFGRSQSILFFEVGSILPLLIGLVLLMYGPRHLQRVWFAFFFMAFMVPLPSVMVDTVTQPMKMAVSYVAELILQQFDYPIARSGVILQIGPYQLLVADACAGLHTLFTLEAMGLLYLNVVRHSSWLRNVVLAILVVPISFAANVIRVMALTLVTYHLGDEAGQGFLHGFAGMVLFMSALILIIGTDSLLRKLPWLNEFERAA